MEGSFLLRNRRCRGYSLGIVRFLLDASGQPRADEEPFPRLSGGLSSPLLFKERIRLS